MAIPDTLIQIARYLLRHGMNTFGYTTISAVTDLFKDIILFYKYLNEEHIKPFRAKLVTLWQKHQKFLQPIFGVGRSGFKLLFSDGTFKERAIGALTNFLHTLPTVVLIASAGVLANRCVEMYEIYNVVKEINKNYEQIGNNVEELHQGAKDIKELLQKLADEKITEKEEILLLDQIDEKLKLMECYQPTLDLIEKVRNEILANTIPLEEARKANKANAIVSGVTGVLSFGLILINPLSTTVGIMNVAAGALICGTSIALTTAQASILKDFSQKRQKLDQYEKELKELKIDYDNFVVQRDSILEKKIFKDFEEKLIIVE